MFDHRWLQSDVAGQRPAPTQDAPGTPHGPGPRDRAGTADVAGSQVMPAGWVEPSADLVALWAAIDAALGEPDVPASYAETAAERLDDFDLVELIARLERDASHARARQLVAVEVLSRRASMNPSWPITVAQPNVAGEEVAAALGTSRAAGRELVDTARLFAGPLLATATALEAGQIDWGKARIVAAVLGDVAVQVAADVQDRVLPHAGRRTHTQLRADLAKALIVVDPTDAEQRTVRAVDHRRVCRPKVLADGMAGIWAVLPAAVAAAIDTALTATARHATHAGDPRTTDQLRADAFAAALIGTGTGAHRHGPGGSGGSGDAVSSHCPGASFGPSATTPAATEPALAGVAPTGPAPTGPAPSVPSPPNPLTLAGGVHVDVTVSLATLLGLDENPGQLAGYGPITAQTARQLAAAGTWRRLVTDPLTGTVLDVGTTRYHPPADLAAMIRARDHHCLSMICAVAADRCDLDHREPFHPDGTGGATSAANLGPLCRRDHLIKTHARWHLSTDPQTPGSYTWTTPTGHSYPYRPDPPPGHEPPLTRDFDWDTPPPF
ncbi:DUF222 domain-containing protein [Pengzhenrongella frigida]|uniref:HNH endonuclease n=1 Tax=Pengzhenrongella frigida TaxID=1259133 RepID=A0A4Q5MZ45_9MICO|nr:DUF222 domain-containing protein [Cellulomonas sp. HLT2-17]RYV50956.1 HNH endonuclease [Cellulomonas sp. HLT2-17]